MLVQSRKVWGFFAALLMVTSTLAASGLALHVSQAKRDSLDPSPDARFDTDRDGYVSIGEFAAQGEDARAFREADADRDGRLNSDEFIKARSIDQRIKTGKYFDDAWITARVKAQLLKDNLLDSFNIRVETQNGVVRLSGEVKTIEQASRAIRMASTVRGVISVHNGLVIR